MADETGTTSRGDLAWSIAVGGICVVVFAVAIYFAWYFAATLFLIFAGILLGVALNSLTNLLGRAVGGPHPLRLIVVCLLLAALLSGVVYLGGSTIAQQATALSNTIKGQIGNLKAFLDQHGVDTSYFNLNAADNTAATILKPATTTPDNQQVDKPAAPKQAPTGLPDFPSAGTIASGGGAIVTQTFKLLIGTLGAVGNFFIVLFLGLAFAAQPRVYRHGILGMTPARYRRSATDIVDRISSTLERWLTAQIVTMAAVFLVTWIGLEVIGIQGAFILGIQAGALAFIPTIGALLGGMIVVLASLASGWVAAASAFALFLGVHALESYVLTPVLQRQALEIPPATLFAFQILLGVVFGIWGLALALPLMAISKVIIDYVREDGDKPREILMAKN